MSQTFQPELHSQSRSLKQRNTVTGWLFVLPNLVGFCAFTLVPVLMSIVMSFSDWNGFGAFHFTGLENYRIIFGDSSFRIALWNTIVFAVFNVLIVMVLSFLLAMLLNRHLVGRNLFRATIFFPYMVSSLAASCVWGMLLQRDYGLVNQLLRSIGIANPPGWAASSQWAMATVVLVTVWKSAGYYMVIFLAGLQSVPVTLYEAATIDGASPLQQTFSVTIPMLQHTTYFVLMMLSISSFQIFDLIYLMTKGGPGRATLTLSQYIYDQGFSYFNVGRASAAALVLFVIVAGLTMLQKKFEKNDF